MKKVSIVLCLLVLAACGSSQSDREEDPALRSLFEALEKNPTSAQANHGLALALHGAGRRDEALPYFEKAAEIDPSPPVLLDLARCYVMLSRMQEAESIYGRVLADNPNEIGALYDMGNIALARGDSAGAIDFYRKVVEVQPQHILALHNMGAALQQTNQLEGAYRTFEKVVEIDPDSADELEAFDDALLRMASMDLQMGATERAVGLIEVLLQAVPNHESAHYVHAQALMKLGRQEDAQAAMTRHQQIVEAQAGTQAADSGAPAGDGDAVR